ncbi:hypothetical protein HY224_02610 [Candidatus Uhrbacteria bacterium]|nr:hypothetical protein [Candidatus Uhrbacteria bacterium]
MTAKPITSNSGQTVTDGQKKQYRRFMEDVTERTLKEAGLDKDSIQRFLGNGDEFYTELLTLVKKHSVTDEFSDEEVESSYGYPAGYKPLGITEQTNCLRELFPGCGYADEKLAEQELPDGAEGWFAIPRWEKFGSTYAQALERVIAKLKELHGDKFFNYREGALTDKHVRLTERTAARLKLLGEQQKGYDLMVVPSQFGLRHRGRSVRRARVVFISNEFGLDPFSAAIMLLTHPMRLQRNEDLCIDCAGADYRPSGSGSFSYCLSFGWSVGELNFDYNVLNNASENFGSASAFGGASA